MMDHGQVTFKLLFIYTILLLALLSGCASPPPIDKTFVMPDNKTFIMPETKTYLEESRVLVAVPVIPVEIHSIK
jgi:uncharacterized lipoprotein YmbA